MHKRMNSQILKPTVVLTNETVHDMFSYNWFATSSRIVFTAIRKPQKLSRKYESCL